MTQQDKYREIGGRQARAAVRGVGVSAIMAFLLILAPARANAQDYPRYPAAGTTFVPLDSWVYPIFERLIGLGYVNTAMLGMKPWARTECARLTDEAAENFRLKLQTDDRPDELSARMLETLQKEFAFELDVLGGGRNRSAALESVYARVLSISGPPLTDGFHFGQTIDYDFGRPFRRGTNAIAGASARATYGPLAIQLRGEYQHAPSAPPVSDALLDVVALRDFRPRPAAVRLRGLNRPRLLDTHAGLNLGNWLFSFGKQSLSWQVGAGGSLLLSNNAEPLYMFRITRILPSKPRILGWLGPARTEFFASRLQGHEVFSRPVIYGMKLSIRPTPNLELAYSRTSMLGGGGRPITFGGLVRSLFGIKRSLGQGHGNFREGDSRNSLEWSYRMPRVRDFLTFYAEWYADDDEAGFMNPPKSVYRPGLRLVQFPGLPSLQLFVEAANSESPGRPNHRGSLNYWNRDYPEGYTNLGNPLGNTVGRQGQALLAGADYYLSERQVLQLRLKESRVKADFIPGGIRWSDYSAKHQIRFRCGIYLTGALQWELVRKFQLQRPGAVSNVTASFEVGLLPNGK